MRYHRGKSNIASSIIPFIHSYIILNNVDTYIEPFVGGANIIDKVQCSKKFGYDNNKYLIALFRHLQNGGELPESISREQYTDARVHYNAKDKYYPDWYFGAIGFLSGTCAKLFDKCYTDTESSHYIEERQNILDQMKYLSDVTFDTCDYREIEPHKALIYCDPPYAGIKGHSKVTKEFNHKEFWDKMREWSKDNIVIISEENAPDDFDVIWEQDEDKKSTEKLFIHNSLNISTEKGSEYDF